MFVASHIEKCQKLAHNAWFRDLWGFFCFFFSHFVAAEAEMLSCYQVVMVNVLSTVFTQPADVEQH